jgi:hypothetical protein
MIAALFLLILLVVIPALSLRHGAESRTGFASPIDWRRIDS